LSSVTDAHSADIFTESAATTRHRKQRFWRDAYRHDCLTRVPALRPQGAV